MQGSFICCLFVFSSLFLGNSLITSGNQTVRFLCFVYSVFWDSTSYTAISVFWMILMERLDASTRWCPWACLKKEMCFWPAKTRKNLELFEMPTGHWTGAQMWFRHNWKKQVRNFLSLHYSYRYSCVRFQNEFSSAVFQVSVWNFLLLHFEGNVCNWIPKVNWPWMEWFRVFFCCRMAFLVGFISVWNQICRNCSFFTFFVVIRFFWCLVWGVGILVCSSKLRVPFINRILYYQLISFRNARQLYLLFFCVSQPFFLETFCLLRGTKLFVFSALFTVSFEIPLRILQ